MRRLLWITLAAASLLAGCASGAIGSACSGSPTQAGACVEGAVCAPNRSSSVEHPTPPNAAGATCRQICDIEADCAEPGFECRVVAGSMSRACQPADELAADAGT